MSVEKVNQNNDQIPLEERALYEEELMRKGARRIYGNESGPILDVVQSASEFIDESKLQETYKFPEEEEFLKNKFEELYGQKIVAFQQEVDSYVTSIKKKMEVSSEDIKSLLDRFYKTSPSFNNIAKFAAESNFPVAEYRNSRALRFSITYDKVFKLSQAVEEILKSVLEDANEKYRQLICDTAKSMVTKVEQEYNLSHQYLIDFMDTRGKTPEKMLEFLSDTMLNQGLNVNEKERAEEQRKILTKFIRSKEDLSDIKNAEAFLRSFL